MTALAGGFELDRGASADECWSECVKVFRAIGLGPIGEPSFLGIPFATDLTYGINSHGDVVWFGQDLATSGSAPIRSFVRLTENKFGLTAGVAYELLPPASLSDRTVVVATDINDDGWIVGYAGSEEAITNTPAMHMDHDARAVIWRLDQTSGSPPVIPAYNAHPGQVQTSSGDTATGCNSFLHAVNNDSPPMVAGRVNWQYCADSCEPNSLADWTVGFSRCGSLTTVAFGHFGTGGTGGSPGAPVADGGWAAVLDISTSDPVIGPFPLSVGYDGSDAPTCPPTVSNDGCQDFDSPVDGLMWGFGSSTPISLLELGAPNDRGRTEARGVVTGGHIVGGSALPIGMSQLCTARATYWPTAVSMGVDLWDFCAGGDEANQAEAIAAANGIVPAADLIAVGGTEQAGLVWLDRVVGGWCCNRLSEITVNAIPSIPDSPLDVRYAHDLSPTGQIVGHGQVIEEISPGVPGAVNHAMILTCVFDLNGDLRINSADFGLLLLNFNAENEVLDLDCDGVIGAGDLGMLLLAWTGEDLCRIGEVVIDCGCEQAMASSASTAVTFEQAVALAGFGTVDALVEWGTTASPLELETTATFLVAIMHALGPPTG